MALEETKVEGLVLEHWMFDAMNAVQIVALEHSKRFEFVFSEPSPDWLKMQVFKGDKVLLEVWAPKRASSTEMIEDLTNVIQLHRSA